MEIRVTSLLALQIVISMSAASVELVKPGPSGYLICETGVALQILPNKTVRGTTDRDDPYVIRLYRTGNPGTVIIYGLKSKRFLCMTGRNKAVGRRRKSRRCTFKIVELQENFASLSYTNKGKTMYFGLNRSGKPRPGLKRSPRTKFIWRPRNYKELSSLEKSDEWLLLLYTNVLHYDDELL